MNELILFISTYTLVFALGLQSLNVNGGHYYAAFITSFFIGASQMILLKLGPNANLTEIAAYLMGGPLGIITSMAFHKRYIKKERRPNEIIKPVAPATGATETAGMDRQIENDTAEYLRLRETTAPTGKNIKPNQQEQRACDKSFPRS